jgi:hypothetical protein
MRQVRTGIGYPAMDRKPTKRNGKSGSFVANLTKHIKVMG